MITTPRFAVVLAASLLSLSAARAVTVNFNSASDLDLFTMNGSASTEFTHNASGGIGGSGGLASTSTLNFDSASAIYTTGLDNVIGASLSVSMDYQMALQGNGPDLRLGFTTSVNGTFDGPGDAWIETYGAEPLKNFAFNYEGFPFDPVEMTEGNWFRLEVVLTRVDADTYSVAANLFDLGSSGVASPTLLGSGSMGFDSATLAAAPELFAGVYLQADTTGFDNFTVVPEPSSLALIGFAGFFAFRRRRK